ncbi:MAG: hypothetical protein KDB27_23060 [Planctomycetales bacterium]|nr:hypothetical protein [Planctomycetales bacterium]
MNTAEPLTLTIPQEASLFRHVRWRMAWATLCEQLATRRLRIAIVVVLSLILWGIMFAAFFEGFLLLKRAIVHTGLLAQSVHAIYNVFFLSLFSMLAISSGIILFTMLYQSRDTQFLLTTPTRPGRIVLYKFQEAVVFSSWGFILLGSPLLLAYGVVMQAPAYYYLMLPAFMLSFAAIPAGIGAIGCLLVVRFLPKVRAFIAILFLAAFCSVLGLFAWKSFSNLEEDIVSVLWFQQTLSRMEYAEQRYLPSWWLSSGLLEAAHPSTSDAGAESWKQSLGFLFVLVTNALVIPKVIFWVGDRVFRTSFSEIRGVGNRPVRQWLNQIDRLLLSIMSPLPTDMRLLLAKDIKTFRRDPMHWMQFSIFFGLMIMYLLYMQRFHYDDSRQAWITAIGYMNVAVIGLLLSTFMTRFIFPMISLEGRRIWILGTLPVRRSSILMSKFIFACGISILPCSSVIFASDVALQIAHRQPVVAAIHQLTCVALCLGLSALATGMGARLPTLREDSPSRIAAGFGGTLTLVLSTAFVFTLVAITSIPAYFCFCSNAQAWYGSKAFVAISLAAAMLLTACAVYLPLHLGMRYFDNAELN